MPRLNRDGRDLHVKYPDVFSEWGPGNTRTPDSVTIGSDYRAEWVCRKDSRHVWKTTATNRIRRGSGCPYCAGQRCLPEHSIVATHPKVVAEWSPNNTRSPAETMAGSDYRAEWVCKRDPEHRWWAVVGERCLHDRTGCPYCNNKLADSVRNLQNHRPDLEAEWDPENQKPMTSFRPSSGVKVKWICVKGHRWEATVASRSGPQRSGCPHCANRHSRGELELYNFVKSLGYPDAINGDKKTIRSPSGYPMELDVLIPSLRTAIEYNGNYWHGPKYNGPEKDARKAAACRRAGVRLLVVWEDDWEGRRGAVERWLRIKLASGRKP